MNYKELENQYIKNPAETKELWMSENTCTCANCDTETVIGYPCPECGYIN